MNLRQFFIGRALGFIVVLVLLGLFATYKYVYAPKGSDEGIMPQRMTLVGEYTCLQLKDRVSTDTAECMPALKADDGKYYSLDINLISMIAPQAGIGDRIEGTGLVTPFEMLSSDNWQKYNMAGIFSVTDSMKKINTAPISYTCNMDGKICPDGSTVGRTGSDCQFKACPVPEAKTATITTSMGQIATGLHVSITPKELVSDSRCPSGVQCIWAGTVEVKAVVATEVSHGENVYKLGETANFGAYNITLTEVTPYPKEPGTIPASSYRFTFKVDKK